jgi:hypothetical protein
MGLFYFPKVTAHQSAKFHQEGKYTVSYSVSQKHWGGFNNTEYECASVSKGPHDNVPGFAFISTSDIPDIGIMKGKKTSHFPSER